MRLADAGKKLWTGGVPKKAQPFLAGMVAFVLCMQHADSLGRLWDWYSQNREAVVPFATGVGGLIALSVAFGQFKTARLRHEEQTRADLQRRIIESFSKAIEQLGSDKLEVRLGGIYTMERISKESPSDYWVVMETLTAFVRERARWMDDPDADSAYIIARREGHREKRSCPTDIQAVMTVFGRRDENSRKREASMGWKINLNAVDLRAADLRGFHFPAVSLDNANLRGADMRDAHLEGARFFDGHLEGAILRGAHLQGADFRCAHLEMAHLQGAHLEGAFLMLTHLEQARLNGANLEGARLDAAHLEEARLDDANLEGAHLRGANLESTSLFNVELKHTHGLDESQIARAIGDAMTALPEGIQRPRHWPPAIQP